MQSNKKPLLLFIFGALFIILPIYVKHKEDAKATFLTGNIKFLTAKGEKNFFIEIAEKKHELKKGLMFRKELKENSGMLFIFEDQMHLSMWMKNTYIPLDMVFINSSNKVVDIVKNTKPLSKEIISPLEPAKYVLEINAGMAEKSGLNIGDSVIIER